ncbi:membrane protein [Streptococcus mitis]|uniref:Membrane protein n=1 Tax=Streptococcus mitis TaxID=28037 RepID=A0A7G1IVJ6_STRMT|nr:membrane protein [Streptococcus mitis]
MKKENEYEKENKRVLLFLIPVVLGAFLYMFVDMLKAGAESHGIMLDVKVLIPWLSAICLLLGFVGIVLTFNFLKKSRKFHSLYQEEMDDDLNETYYVQMYRDLEFGNITSNITSVAILLALVISGSEVIVLDVSRITFSLSFLELVLFLQSQKYLSKTIAIVRQFDLELFATPKDVLDYINSYDEGERQANLEQSFRILFQLNQYVLPGLYIFLFIISVLTGEIQLLAFLLVGAIHIYINVMQIPMVKRYFK